MTATMGAILSDVTSIVTSATGWMGSFVNFITANPLVLAFVTVPFIGLGVGLIRRLMSL